jgi:hypothetical protein
MLTNPNNQNSFFRNMSSVAVATEQNEYARDGRYRVEILDVKKNIGKKPQNLGQMSIILKLNVKEVLVGYESYTTPNKKTYSSNKVNEIIVVHIKWAWGESAVKLFKSFLIAAGGLSQAEAAQISDEQWYELSHKAVYHTGDDIPSDLDPATFKHQPLAGAQLNLKAWTIETEKHKKDFTKLQFEVLQ